MATSLLSARALSRSFTSGDSRFTLTIDELVLTPGSVIAVVGPSGCGKSTMLGLLSLALRPDAGQELTIAGADALELWRRGRKDGLAALRAQYIGFVPQTAALLPYLSLRANIALSQAVLGRSDPEVLEAAAAWLGISHVLSHRPGDVSVGQRQRAAVARAIAHRPPIILADEPTAAVHPAQAETILRHLVAIPVHTGACLIMTTHDQPRAEAAGFRIAPCEVDETASSTRFTWVP